MIAIYSLLILGNVKWFSVRIKKMQRTRMDADLLCQGWVLRVMRGRDLNQFQQIFPAQTCLVKNINKCSFCEFLMQRNDGSIGCLLRNLFKRYMAALLPDYNESCLFKRSDEFFPGNNWQFRHGLLQLWSRAAWISHEVDLLQSFRYKAQ